MMRKLRWLSLCCALMLGACSQGEPSLQTLEGHTLRLSDYRGKWVFINYWAPWCPPCRAEIPELNAFYAAHRDRVVVLGVNFDQLPPQQLKETVEKMGIQFPILVTDPAAQLGIDTLSSVPVTYIISPEGRLLPPLLGEQHLDNLNRILR